MKFKFLFLLLVLALPVALPAAPQLSDYPDEDDVRIELDCEWSYVYHFDQKSVDAKQDAYLLYWQFLGSSFMVKFGLGNQMNEHDSSIHKASAILYNSLPVQKILNKMSSDREIDTPPDIDENLLISHYPELYPHPGLWVYQGWDFRFVHGVR